MKSIKTKLVLAMTGIMLTIFCFQMAANYLLSEKYYVSAKTKEIKAVYQEMQEAQKQEDLISIAETAEEENNLRFILANKDRLQIYNSRREKIRTEESLKADVSTFSLYAVPEVLKGKNTVKVQLNGMVEIEEGTYYVQVATTANMIKDSIKRTNLFILYIGGLALLVGIIVIYLVADRISKPIEEISQVAVRVSNMDFSLQSKYEERKDEIGSLSRNINFMSKQLEKNITELKDFIANVSHELKTPLAVLSGYTQMIKMDTPGIDKQFYLEVILDETEKLNTMVKQLIDLSCMENQLQDIQKERINIKEFLEYLVRKNEVFFLQKDILLETNIDTEAFLYGNSGYLEQAVVNLLNNAREHTKAGDRVILSAWQSKRAITISVYNQGEEISEEKLKYLWNSFYRGDEARSRTENGNMGLGLYIVKAIVEAHHGRCGVENHEEGVEFFLTLPID
jgi:signal transduction histidine kinase